VSRKPVPRCGKKKGRPGPSLEDEFDQFSREMLRTGVGDRLLEALKRRRASKPDDDWDAWAIAWARGAVRSVALEMIVEEMRRDPPDRQMLAEAADLLAEILSDDTAKSPDPKQERRERRRFEARLVQADVDALAAKLERQRCSNPVEQALQTVALERGVTASKADPFTANPEGKALAKWLQRNR
jgi:hypothetical protein